MPELFLEIGTEEIPARFISLALDYLEKEIPSFLKKNRIQASEPRVMGSPRRLVISFNEVGNQQEDIVETHFGPNVKLAYDEKGDPTKSALGFARGKGIDPSQLTLKKTPKGEVVCARIEKAGQPTSTILNDFFPILISKIPFPKKMRWGNRKTPFVRPLHWIVALFGSKPLNFSYEGIPCADISRGHRFMHSDFFKVTGMDDYLKSCEKYFLMIDPVIRKKSIVDQVTSLANEVGGAVELDPELLEEVNYLVEYPFAIRGNFEKQFLELPRELLITTMKYHQKYFSLKNKHGDLLPYFITISNVQPGPGGEILRGNERVLRARLQDARLFFDEDRKKKIRRLCGVIKRRNLSKISRDFI